ncbi:MAG: Glu/Leu/Phe/Val dehydrogenase dimerization domain-containing protein [Spirochaetales bacterium]|nr:Glu/Leu/Phe/Val dehydrogenase dimerization domain-containing protein [Spirochaetales bacterium]
MTDRDREVYLRELYGQTGKILEDHFRVDINTKEKILEEYFSEGYLPLWYFYSNSPLIIAHHIYMLTHFLNANSDMLSHSGKDNLSRTYFINVGRDYPGRLAHIVEQNEAMDIMAIDSEETASGLRIVTLEKRGESTETLTDEERRKISLLKERVLSYGREKGLAQGERFLETLGNRYLREEITVHTSPERIIRHLNLFEKAVDSGTLVMEGLVQDRILRLSVAVYNPSDRFITASLEYFRRNRINLERSYYDLFEGPECRVGIFSFYLDEKEGDFGQIRKELTGDLDRTWSQAKPTGITLDERLEKLIRCLSTVKSGEELTEALGELGSLCRKNLEPGEELGNFYLNSVTDFMTAAEGIGLDKSPELLGLLLGFERFDEFYVPCPHDGMIKNRPGYRIKHSTIRGASKGGLRIDSIVNFCEVAALSFMMTWKSARSRILFGGAKGGLMLNPREYDPRSMDFFDALSNFGRSLFLVTGPSLDVPAGDVGCGAREIGRMFEGFKSALRDLALMVNGVRHNVTMIGDQIISLEEARLILKEAFQIDYNDRKVLRELGVNQEYLELVVAAQITGKPRMGLEARNGATGRGLSYAALAAVTNQYLAGNWEPAEQPDEEEDALLREAADVTVETILDSPGGEVLSEEKWERLHSKVFPKLLRGKRMVVQGSGKVGSSVIREMDLYGVDLIALSDAGGAVIGTKLDPEGVLKAVEDSRGHEDSSLRASVINYTEGEQRIYGAREGGAILELECDLLFPAALENAVTEENAPRIRTKIEVCGSNGSNSSKAEKILQERGILVVYDFLANSAGVTASYFEWLRNLWQRARYEAENIYRRPFDDSLMDDHIMAEFRTRIKGILQQEESPETTRAWNGILRDIMFSAVNEDYRTAARDKVSLKTAGFRDAQFRVLAAALSSLPPEERERLISPLPEESKKVLTVYENHPEIKKTSKFKE